MVFAHIIRMLFLQFSHALPMPFLEHSHAAIRSPSRSILMILLAYSHTLFPHPIALPEYSHAFLPKCVTEHSHSIPTASPKNSHGVPIVLPGTSLSAPRPLPSYRVYSHSIHTVFAQYAYGVPIVCSYYSYDVPLIFPRPDHAGQLAVSHPAKPRRPAL